MLSRSPQLRLADYFSLRPPESIDGWNEPSLYPFAKELNDVGIAIVLRARETAYGLAD